MTKIILIQNHKETDITSYVSTINWSGSKAEAARKLEISMVNSIKDVYTVDCYIKNGSMLKLIENQQIIFEGFVFFNEKSSGSSVVTVTAYDRLIYMLKSKASYNIKNESAEQITDKICKHFQIPIGKLAKTNVKQSFVADGKTLYDIMMKAYTEAAKTTMKKYMPKMNKGKLDIIEIGEKLCSQALTDATNITNCGYSETASNMVNRVKIYDDKGKVIDTVENADWVKRYGVLQAVYRVEKDKNEVAMAKEMLQDVQKDISVSALGSTECVAGNSVQVKDQATGLTGLFYIDQDSHTWQNGQHMMNLKLNFKKIMDERM